MKGYVYIAGPMTGLIDLNYSTFFAAARALALAGFAPINPAREEGRENCKTWLDFMRASLIDLSCSDGIALLPGWEDSRGASLEAHIIRSLGLPVGRVDEWCEGLIL